MTDSIDPILKKVSIHLLPFMFVLYIISFLDRINISFVGLEMGKDLGFDDRMFGFGAGIFFVGYCLFGLPGNIILSKFGARRWITLIMVLWGIVSVAMAFINDATTFVILRFLLGVAESGFFPGMILYLTYWYPKKQQGKAVAGFMTAIPCAGILGGLVAAKALAMHGALGIAGWKWLFLLTGTPAIIFGMLCLVFLPDSAADARWLTKDEKQQLAAGLDQDRTSAGHGGTISGADVGAMLFNPKVWLLSALYFLLATGFYGFQLWLPQIIATIDHSSASTTALLTILPAIFQAIGMNAVAISSDRTGERQLHLAGSLLLAAVALVLAGVAGNPIISLSMLCLCAFGLWGTLAPFWALPPKYMNPAQAGAAIGLINSVGNLGGFAGPYIIGAIKSQSSSFTTSLFFLAGALLVGACLALYLKSAAVRSTGLTIPDEEQRR